MIKNKSMEKSKENNSVEVIIRVRPIVQIEEGSQQVVEIMGNVIIQDIQQKSMKVRLDDYNEMEIAFDKILGQRCTQKDVFMQIKPKVKSILEGFNLTIFAYGQTGSGKTFTMFGDEGEQFVKRSQSYANQQHSGGLIPRTAFYLFQCLGGMKGNFNVFCSFLQIYNQKIYDLLQDSVKPKPLQIHQSKYEGIFVEGLAEFKIHSFLDCLNFLKKGQKNRHIRQTSMNAKSSRSHSVFQILLQSTKTDEKGKFTMSKLTLCDLAGSQKINKNENMEEQHFEQLKRINLSLTTLGKVINSLSKGTNLNNASFFRQSKLTRLLQNSLIGNTKTIIMGTISPSQKCQEQTINTLKFAQRARHIKMVVRPSYISTKNSNNQIVKNLQKQVEEFKKILNQKNQSKVEEPSEQIMRKLWFLEKKNKQLVEENRRIKEALGRMERIAYANMSENTSQRDLSEISLSQHSSNQQKNNKKTKNSLPQINSPQKITNKQKIRLINRFQNMQQINKNQQLTLMKDLKIIQQQQHKRQKVNKSLQFPKNLHKTPSLIKKPKTNFIFTPNNKR